MEEKYLYHHDGAVPVAGSGGMGDYMLSALFALDGGEVIIIKLRDDGRICVSVHYRHSFKEYVISPVEPTSCGARTLYADAIVRVCDGCELKWVSLLFGGEIVRKAGDLEV